MSGGQRRLFGGLVRSAFRSFPCLDAGSGRRGRARARDARPKGRDPQPEPTATRSGASMAQSAWLLARQGSPVAKRCARNITRRVSEIGCSVISKTCRLLETREAWKAPRTVKTFSLTNIDRPPPRIPQPPSWPRIGASEANNRSTVQGRTRVSATPWAMRPVSERERGSEPAGRGRPSAARIAGVRRRTRSWPPQGSRHRAAPSCERSGPWGAEVMGRT